MLFHYYEFQFTSAIVLLKYKNNKTLFTKEKMWKGGKKQKPSGAQYRKKRRDLEIAVLRNSQTLPELFKARMQTDHEKVNELSKGVA